MPTFKKTEVIDARQFTGGNQNAMELILWVNSGDQEALWASPVTMVKPTSPEKIMLVKPDNKFEYDSVYLGDWIVKKQSGQFVAMRPEELQEYEIV